VHIIFIHQVFISPEEAGSTRHFELARHLVKKGHRVTIISSAVNYLTGKVNDRFKRKFLSKEIVEGVEIMRTWTYPGIHMNYIARFISFISFMFSSILGGFHAGKIDAVIACSPQIFTGVSGYVVSRVKRVPFIFEIRDLWPKFAIETRVLTNARLISLAGSLERWVYKRADHFIINSPGFYEHLEGFNIPKERISLVSNGVDTKVFTPGERYNPFREEMGLGKKFTVMYAGAHGRANGLDTVIEAAKILKGRSDIIFMMVGDGKEKDDLIRLSEGYGLKNVLFVGAQTKRKMPEICRSADVCLAILQKREAFKTVYPNKIFDYMASGRPTILAIDGVAREVLEKSEGGIFVEPEDPDALAETVLTLYNNRELAERYGENARKYVVENFDREKIAEDLNDILLKVAGNTIGCSASDRTAFGESHENKKC